MNRSNCAFKGRYKIVTLYKKPWWIISPAWLWAYRKGLLNSWVKDISPWHSNLIMLGTNTGLNLVLQHLSGDTTFPLEVDNASLGTGTTAPTSSDTNLETPVLEDIVRAIGELSATDTFYSEWFVTDDELPDGTYNEIGLFSGVKIFARSIISPSHTKGAGEDTLFVYEIVAHT